MTEKFAVFGNPIAHSKSPEIHLAFARQFNRNIEYTRILASEKDFSQSLRKFFADGGTGCNVTVPFKQTTFDLCEVLSPAASRAQAVNTVYFDTKGRLCGHNSDGIGLVNDLTRNYKLSLSGRHITILGAGGATRGIMEPLVSQQPASISLINRNPQRARLLAEEFSDIYSIVVYERDNLANAIAPDLLINATSASLSGDLPLSDAGLVSSSTFCYDMAYASEPTSYLCWAQTNGAGNTSDGLGMLVEQAAESFATWTNLHPDTGPIILDMAAQRR